MDKAVAYIRVSTVQQGRSGLGIEAQRDAIQRFAEAEGLELTAEFVEVETGKGPMPWIAGRNWQHRCLPLGGLPAR